MGSVNSKHNSSPAGACLLRDDNLQDPSPLRTGSVWSHGVPARAGRDIVPEQQQQQQLLLSSPSASSARPPFVIGMCDGCMHSLFAILSGQTSTPTLLMSKGRFGTGFRGLPEPTARAVWDRFLVHSNLVSALKTSPKPAHQRGWGACLTADIRHRRWETHYRGRNRNTYTCGRVQ
jgi:hypothetical protein